MNAKTLICDGCEKPITTTNAPLAFIPLRGGLRLVATNENGSSSADVDREMHFHGADCLSAWSAKLKAPEKKAEAKPAK